MIDSLTYVTNLSPTIKDDYGMKRNLTGYNVYLRYFYQNFKLLTDSEQRDLLCSLGVHSVDMYLLIDEDSIVPVPKASDVDIIKAAATKWRRSDLAVKDAWRQLALEINQLPILGAFNSIPSMITDEEIGASLSRDHHNKFISTSSKMLRTTRISMKQDTKTKNFGKESVEIGNQVFKSFFLSYLLNLCFFWT